VKLISEKDLLKKAQKSIESIFSEGNMNERTENQSLFSQRERAFLFCVQMYRVINKNKEELGKIKNRTTIPFYFSHIVNCTISNQGKRKSNE